MVWEGFPQSTHPRLWLRQGAVVILICAASDGNNLKIAHTLSTEATALGLDNKVLDLVSLEWPLYSPTAERRGPPEKFPEVQDAFSRATGFVFCAPEYNGSIPPVLTSVIAWLSVASEDFRQLFNEKPVGLATHSGSGGQKVLLAMRVQMSHLGSNVVGRELLTTSQKPLRKESVHAILNQIDKWSGISRSGLD